VEFGRIQARDLLQHLLTGPISNAPVDIVRVRGWAGLGRVDRVGWVVGCSTPRPHVQTCGQREVPAPTALCQMAFEHRAALTMMCLLCRVDPAVCAAPAAAPAMPAVQGSKSVEVRPVGVSKGASMERILQFMAGEAQSGGMWLFN